MSLSVNDAAGVVFPKSNANMSSLQAYVKVFCNGTLGKMPLGSLVGEDGAIGVNMSGLPDGCCIWNTSGCPGNETLADEGNPYNLAWYIKLIYIVAFAGIVLVGGGGNIVVIWIVVAHKRMRTVTNYFLVNLAVADALITILNTLFNSYYMMSGNNWPFGRGYCKFSQFIAPCTISASVFTFMAIAIDRYMAIIHPLRPRMSSRTVLAIIAVIWVASILIAVPNLLYSETHTWEYTDGFRTVCYLQWPDGTYNTTDFWYNVFIMLVNYFVPLGILSGTYACVGRELWGSRAIGEYTSRQEENVRSKRKVVKMMMVVVAIFAVCWLPQHLFFLLSCRYHSIINLSYIQHVYLAIYWLAMSNSMYNPIIYCWMNARFRKGFKYVFRWLPCIHYHHAESLNRPGDPSMGVSVSEGTRFERNGSMMTTMMESVDETSYAGTHPTIMHRGFTPMKREFTSSENSF